MYNAVFVCVCVCVQLIYCPKGHHLSQMSLPDLQRRGTEYAGGFCCDGCSKGTSVSLFHCDLCNFDLCRACGMAAVGRSQCPIGHPLLRFTKDDLLAYDKHNCTRVCNACNKSCSGPFMMICPTCKYNMCPCCYKATVVCLLKSCFLCP